MTSLLRPTLGPLPRTVAISPIAGSQPPEILDNAAIIARRTIQLTDPFEDMGGMLVRHLAWRVFERVGDGGASAAVLACALVQAGTRYIAAGGNPQQRIEAMIAGVAIMQPPLDKFYSLLNDEQKARLNALAEDQRRSATARKSNRPLVQSCDVAPPAALTWPNEEIEARLHPTEAQRASLAALQNASAKAADMLRTSCRADEAVTPPARLAAVGKRLDTMLQAVKLVRASLDGFYATLSDEQKAQFEAIGPRRTAASDQAGTSRHRRGRDLFGN